MKSRLERRPKTNKQKQNIFVPLVNRLRDLQPLRNSVSSRSKFVHKISFSLKQVPVETTIRPVLFLVVMVVEEEVQTLKYRFSLPVIFFIFVFLHFPCKSKIFRERG